MTISSFCIEQREQEQKTLKRFLSFSLVGSAVLHVGLVFGISWLWTRQPEISDDPIEVTVVENPDIEEKPLADTPSPKSVEVPSKPVEPPTLQQPIKTEIPQPPVPQPIVPAVPERLVAQPAPVTPAAPERPGTQPAPIAPAAPERPVAQPVPVASAAPTEPTTERQPIISSRPEPIPGSLEPTPISPPSPVATNRSAPPKSDNQSQPLPAKSGGARQLREGLGGNSSSSAASPGKGDSNPGSISPEAVATNRSAPPRPGGSSQPLLRSSPSSQQVRDSLSGKGSSEATSPGSGNSDASSTSQGMAANAPAPPRPGSGSGGQGSGNQGGNNTRGSGTSVGAAGSGNGGQGSGNQGGNTGGSGTTARGAGVACISGCKPKYPSVLNGEEGRAVVRLVLDSQGNVVDSEFVGGNGSSQLNQEALKAARKMKFRVPEGRSRSVVNLTINFTYERRF